QRERNTRCLPLYRLIMLFAAVAWMATASTCPAQSQIVFSDDFESGNLDQWFGKNGGDHHGQIVPDPLNPCTNNVLNFTKLNAAGDIFTVTPLDISTLSGPFVVSFDYLG